MTTRDRLETYLQRVAGTLPLESCLQLYDHAKRVQGGAIVDIGSYQGRSTMALAMGALDGNRAPVFAIEPHERFTGMMGGRFSPRDRWQFVQNLLPERLVERVKLINQEAYQVALGWHQPVSLLLLDADHRHWALRRDAMIWTRFVPVGGMLLIGGAGNAKTGTAQVVQELVHRFGFEAQGRLGSLVVLRRRRMVPLPKPDARPWEWPFPGQVSQAEQRFQEALKLHHAGQAEAAEAAYEKALVLNPLHPGALSNCAVLLKRRGQLLEAENLQRAAVAARPRDAALQRNLASTLITASEPGLALEFLSNAVALQPGDASAWTDLAECWRDLKRYPEAHAALDRAESSAPDNFKIRTTRASVLAAEDRAQEASTLYEQLVQRWPGQREATLNLAAHLKQTGYMDEARALYNTLLSAHPDYLAA